MMKKLSLVTFLGLCLSGLIFLVASQDKQIVTDSIAQQTEPEISRPEGWTEETHGDTADPDYDVVFAQNVVKRIDLTIEPADWQAMLDDMTEKFGEYGQLSCGGLIPIRACEACEELQKGDRCTVSFLFGLIQTPGTCIAMPGGQLVCEPDTLPPGAPGGPPTGIPSDAFFGSTPQPIYRPCTFEFDDKTWRHVGVRFKGQSTLMYPWKLGIMKLPFRFDFDEFEDDYPEINNQRFFGFKELSMGSNFNDNSLLREKVVGDTFREAGVPAPQNTFHRVYVDYGEGPICFGLYTLVEVPRRPMLESQFDDPDGNLYKPEGSGARWGTFDQDSFAKKTNTLENDWSDIEAAFAALHAPRDNPAVWRAGLEAVFDVDGFLRWLAVNTTIQNWDTYGIMPQNYYVYSDPSDGQVHWIPWDNNEALKSTGQLADPLPLALNSTAVDENWPLIRYLMDDPVYRATYLSFVNDTIEGAFAVNPSQARLLNAHNLIAPYVVGPNGEQAGYTGLEGPEAFDAELDVLLAHVEQRHQDALRFLSRENFSPGAIIINEIHYNPSPSQGDDQAYEFIELYNRGGMPIDVSGYSLTEAIQFTFPQGSTIAAAEYIVIANTADTYNNQSYQVFEWESGNLSNGGETIMLKGAAGVVVDFVNYDDLLPWPMEPDGDEPSLSLIDPSLPNSLPGNWRASDGLGGTPGSINFEIMLNVSTISTDLVNPPDPGQTIAVTLTANGQTTPLFYKYLVRSGYQTQTPGSWQTVQDWLADSSTVQWSPQAENNYILIGYVGDDTTGSSFHQAGICVETSGNSTNPIQITEFTTTTTYPQSSGAPLTLTTTAAGENGPLSYRYWCRKGPGGRWTEIRGYDPSNSCTWTPTQAGLYVIVVHVTDDVSGNSFSTAGLTCTIGE